MQRPEHLLACPECACHVRTGEAECPHCGARLRRGDGAFPRTAAAILLGLTAAAMPVAAGTGCGSEVDTEQNGSSNGDGGAGQGGQAQGGMSMAEVSSAAAYGVGGSISGPGGMGGMGGMGGLASAYGVPATDVDMDGYIDQAAGGDDCNDMDANVHPGAPDKQGDGIDSNCDGVD